MRQADRLGVRLVLLLGPDEAKEGVATLRRLADGHQERVPLAAIASRLATEVKAP
jgi:histidyl-tRNA synthetase